jgi:hypothetical protein
VEVSHEGFAAGGEAVAGFEAFGEAEGFEAADAGLVAEMPTLRGR